MIYSVIGTGAVGGYYGCKLAKAGCDVHFLLHSDYDYVCSNGFYVKSCDGDFHLKNINVYNDVTKMPKSDVVIVALKSVNQMLLYKMLPLLLKSDTLVLLIQNGIGLEPDLVEKFPKVSVLAGLAFICSSKTEPGVINHQFYGSINIGNYNCKDIAKVNRLIDDFKNAEIDAHQVEYFEARWKKAVWNMPFNGMSVIHNANTRELLETCKALIYSQMIEVINAAHACGVNKIEYTFADQMIAMTESMVPYYPSMKLDFDYNRPMEIDYLYTRPIEEALHYGFEMKLCKELKDKLTKVSY